MRRTGSRAGSRYRGSRGAGRGLVLLVLVVIAAGAAALAGWRLLGGAPTGGEPDAPALVLPPPLTLPEPEPVSDLPAVPAEVRGIYVSGPVAGDPYMDSLIALLEETELNAVVIDLKNDEGNLTYRAETGTAAEIGACVRYIPDLPGLVSELKARGIYTIARIAAFKDPVLAAARPELALRRADGSAVSESGGLAWVNPYEPEVWDYLIETARGAAQAGFDEVQFDYVRFPTGRAAEEAVYGPAAEGTGRSDAVAGFLEAAVEALHAEGVRVSADVFGTAVSNRADAALIGQDYARMGAIVDVLCPMVYPSHYAAGVFGLELPDRAPYETVRAAMEKSREALSGVEEDSRAQVRPWLQDFTATWVSGHLEYGAEELRAQIQAVCDEGYPGWLLWNARNQYTAEGLLPAAG